MKIVRDWMLMAGLAATGYGLYLGCRAWLPLAWILGGALLVIVAAVWRGWELSKSDQRNRQR